MGWVHTFGDNHQVGELVSHWLEQYQPLANDGDGGTGAGEGSVGVTSLGVVALSCFQFAMTMNRDRGVKLEII